MDQRWEVGITGCIALCACGLEVQRRRTYREPDARRETTLWFAKDWNYLLVRLSQIETDGQHYQIMLKEATVNGQTVTGIPVSHK